MEASSPFREEDPTARLEALQREVEELRNELARVKAETARLTPWSFRKFFLGLLLLPISVTVVVLVFVCR